MTTNPAICDCPKGDLDTSHGMCRCGRHYLSDGAVTVYEQDRSEHSKYFCHYQWDPIFEACEAMRTDEK